MTELDEYKRDMQPDQPEPLCVRLCATVARLRGERRDALEALIYACHSGGMYLSEYVPAHLLADAHHDKGEQ